MFLLLFLNIKSNVKSPHHQFYASNRTVILLSQAQRKKSKNNLIVLVLTPSLPRYLILYASKVPLEPNVPLLICLVNYLRSPENFFQYFQKGHLIRFEMKTSLAALGNFGREKSYGLPSDMFMTGACTAAVCCEHQIFVRWEESCMFVSLICLIAVYLQWVFVICSNITYVLCNIRDVYILCFCLIII